MACNRYGDLMMKYMDGGLSATEKTSLHEHMEACEACAEDFAAYGEILEGFEAMELVEAPPELTTQVMERVAALNLYAPKKSAKTSLKEKVTLVAFALFGFAAVFMVALSLFGTQIVSLLYGLGWFGLLNVIAPIVEGIGSFFANFGGLFVGLGDIAPASLIIFSVAMLLVFAALVALQISLSPAPVKQGENNK